MDKNQIDKLLVKISRGDNAAFEELYERTKKGVFSFLYSYLKNYENTEDAMQSVFLKIKLNAAQYERGTNGSAWIL
ncbi:MAG: RNA polymerase subunit sigma-24, partial [Clostridia bacterium]|nr:RNA polymerase subunit sigma-24 [Clostridia bacterium]